MGLWIAKQIALTKDQIRRLKAVAEEATPFEGCALLLGSVQDGRLTVTDILPAENREHSTVTFQIDPEFVYTAYQRADQEGKDLVAVFHSHPAPPRPSPTDLQYMRVNPIVWLILSTTQDSLEAYQLLSEELQRLKIVRRDAAPSR